MTISRDEAIAELKRRGLLPTEDKDYSNISSKSRDISPKSVISRDEAIAELKRRGLLKEDTLTDEQKAVRDFKWGRFLGEQLTGGALGLGDLSTILSRFSPVNPASIIGASEPEMDFSPVSKPIIGGAKELGVDLQSQGPGVTAPQRIAGAAARGLGTALPFGPVGAAFGALQGAGSQGLQEAGVSPLVAEVSALAAPAAVSSVPSAASRIIKKLLSSSGGVSKLSDADQRVSQYLHGLMGKKEVEKAIKNIEHRPKYPMTGYEPMTAEIAETPALSQLHRLRYETAGSGLPERSASQREALGNALERSTLKAAAPKEIKEMVGNELAKREGIRRAATKEGYESVEKMKEPMAPKNLMKFIKSKEVAGDIRRDLNKIQDEILPLMKQSKSDMEYRKFYESASPTVREDGSAC